MSGFRWYSGLNKRLDAIPSPAAQREDDIAAAVEKRNSSRDKTRDCWSGLDFAVERIGKLEARVAALEAQKNPRPPNHQGQWP